MEQNSTSALVSRKERHKNEQRKFNGVIRIPSIRFISMNEKLKDFLGAFFLNGLMLVLVLGILFGFFAWVD